MSCTPRLIRSSDGAQPDITDRDVRAVDQLGSERPESQIGGTLALERTARNAGSGNGDVIRSVVEVLCVNMQYVEQLKPRGSASVHGEAPLVSHRRLVSAGKFGVATR
jgi:hypothetical protein